MTSARRDQIMVSLGDKEYRDEFVAATITEGLAFQIRAMREDRGWSQAELGRMAGMAQETISLLENPNYGKYTLRTLKRLASAFDVGLVVRFAPFSQMVNWTANLSERDLTVPNFEHDARQHATDTYATVSGTTGMLMSWEQASTLPRAVPTLSTSNVIAIAPYLKASTIERLPVALVARS